MLARLAYHLRKGADKISKANRGKWRTLSTGEKVIKVVLWCIKLAIIATLGLGALAIAAGIWVAFGIMSGLTGAVDDQIQRSYNYRHRNRNW